MDEKEYIPGTRREPNSVPEVTPSDDLPAGVKPMSNEERETLVKLIEMTVRIVLGIVFRK